MKNIFTASYRLS